MTRLRAAAGQVDLQPVAGARLTGFGSRIQPSIGCHDPLMAKVLLLDDGDTKLVWISCDLIGLSPEDDARLRALVARGPLRPSLERDDLGRLGAALRALVVVLFDVARQRERLCRDQQHRRLASAAIVLRTRMRTRALVKITHDAYPPTQQNPLLIKAQSASGDN